MKRILVLAVASLLASMTLVPAASAAGTDDSALTKWFAGEASSHVLSALSSDPELLSSLNIDRAGQLSFGTPVPVVGINPPAFDLRSDMLKGDATLDASLDRSHGEYAARAMVNGSPAPLIALVIDHAGGNIEFTGASEVRFLDDSSAQLPEGGIAETQSGWVGFTEGASQRVVALDVAAKEWIGGDSVDGGDFLTAVAKRKAEYDAIARIDGPIAGGEGPLFAVDEAWQAQVERGLAIPDDQAWDPAKQAASEAASAPGSESEASTAWLLIAVLVAVIVLAAVALTMLLARKRRAPQRKEALAGRE